MATVRRVHHPGQLVESTEIELSAAASRHLIRVLRLCAGTSVTLFDGEGREAPAVISKADPRRTRVRVGPVAAGKSEPPLEIVLVQGISRGARMELVVQKATELGVSAIVPAYCDRSVVRLDPDRAKRRVNHWRQVAAAACEQSGRSRIPEILDPAPLLDALRVRSGYPGLVLDPLAKSGLDGIPRPANGLRLVVGPEGGLTDEELAAACGAECRRVGFGPRILRTETAAMTALAVVGFAWSDLGSGADVTARPAR
jgi:16S rRNA (uracil1498-N3)-methyltransferase